MTKVTKRDGRQQDFSKTKLEKSLRNCGATDEVIRTTVDRINPREGESTASLRSRVATELAARDAGAARCYQSTRRLTAATATDVPEGTIRVHPTTASNHGWRPGQSVEVENGGTRMRMRIEESSSPDALHAQFNSRALESLRATEGTRVNISRV